MNEKIKRLDEMEQACVRDAEYIYQKCREVLNQKYGDEKFAENNPILLSALINSATNIFLHKPKGAIS